MPKKEQHVTRTKQLPLEVANVADAQQRETIRDITDFLTGATEKRLIELRERASQLEASNDPSYLDYLELRAQYDSMKQARSKKVSPRPSSGDVDELYIQMVSNDYGFLVEVRIPRQEGRVLAGETIIQENQRLIPKELMTKAIPIINK